MTTPLLGEHLGKVGVLNPVLGRRSRRSVGLRREAGAPTAGRGCMGKSGRSFASIAALRRGALRESRPGGPACASLDPSPHAAWSRSRCDSGTVPLR